MLIKNNDYSHSVLNNKNGLTHSVDNHEKYIRYFIAQLFKRIFVTLILINFYCVEEN